MFAKRLKYLTNKRILVTGGAGSIGSELVRQLAPGNKIFVLDMNESDTMDLCTELQEDGHWVQPRIGDVRNAATVSDLFEDFKPQVTFHAAAYKHVPPLETYPREAIDTNVIGLLNVLYEAKRWECTEKFVYISTDKAVNSNSIMGATKRLGEIMVRNQGTGYIAVRFGNVMNSRGSLFPIWQRQHDQGKKLTVTDKRMMRFMMTIPQACELVIKAAIEGSGGETFILDMGEPKNIYELACQLVGAERVNVTGIRPGETLDEKIMTDEEAEEAVKKDGYWVIP